MNPPHAPADPAHTPTPAHPAPPVPAAAAVASLVIGARDLAAKDELILRSLVRLLDGRVGPKLHFSEQLADCNVVFLPADWALRLPSHQISLHVLAENASAAPVDRAGLGVTLPLRATNVMAALQAAAALLAQASAPQGLAALFQQLTRHLMANERRTTVLPLADGRRLVVDFIGERVHTVLALDELLDGRYAMAAPHRASVPEIEAALALHGLRLRDLLWAAAHRLGDAHGGDSGAAGAALQGHYRLLRWPDAVALSRPGFPRLAALLTSRAMSVAEVGRASGASAASVSCFLQASLALGLAVLVDAAEVAPAPAASAPSAVLSAALPAAAPPVAAEALPRSLLGRLRERLKLW